MEVAFVPAVITVALVGGRILGLRLGWRRAVVISWVGLASAGVVLQALAGVDTTWQGQAAVIGLGLVAMVVWSAVAELVVPTRRPPGTRRQLNPLLAARERAVRARRKMQLGWMFGRFGAGWLRRVRRADGNATGTQLRLTLERAGGVYVKLGQFLSTRPDVVSDAVAAQLRRLQDDTSTVSTAEVAAIVGAELGSAGPELDPEPIAAASIAQVHRATLADGRTVAVKVQRPGIAPLVERDLDILERAAVRVERRTAWAADIGTAATIRAFARSVRRELDFTAEAANLRALAATLRHDERFVVPMPVDELTTRRVLVMDWIDGQPVDRAASTRTPGQRHDLAIGLLDATVHQLLVAGVFHADPHPGNLLLCPDDRVAFLDCGSVVLLDRRQRESLRRMLVAIARRDPAELRLAFEGMTSQGGSFDAVRLERSLGAILSDQLRPGTRPGAGLLLELMSVLRELGLSLEAEIAGAFRGLATLQSTLEALSPGIDLIGEAAGAWRRSHRPRRAPTTAAGADDLVTTLATLTPMLAALPRKVERALDAVGEGRLSLGVRFLDAEAAGPAGGRIVANVVACLAPVGIGTIGTLLVIAARLGPETSSRAPLQAVGLGCVALALLVLGRQLAAALRSLGQG